MYNFSSSLDKPKTLVDLRMWSIERALFEMKRVPNAADAKVAVEVASIFEGYVNSDNAIENTRDARVDNSQMAFMNTLNSLMENLKDTLNPEAVVTEEPTELEEVKTKKSRKKITEEETTPTAE